MATRKSKSVLTIVVKSTPSAALTLTIPVAKPRNLIAMNPLLKKSSVHTDSQRRNRRGLDGVAEVQQAVQEALNRRRGGTDKGDSDGGDGD